jgi:signal transduction histidine kinase
VKKLSIGLRLTLWYLAIFFLAELIFGAGMWLILRQNLFDIADTALEGQAADLQRFLEARKDLPTAQLQAEISEDYKIERSEDYLQISDASGNFLYRSHFLEEHPLPSVAPDELDRPLYANRKLGHERFRFLSEQVDVSGRIYIVRIGHPMHEEIETLDDFRQYLLWFAPLLLLGASAGGYWLSRRALAPVDALARTARTISGHNLSSRLEQLHTGDELQRLSDTLNEMLGRIESAFLRITEFTADASHELRTPIALIHTEAELALRRSRDEAEYQEALRHILQEADRTAKLIEELLTLARADSGGEAFEMKSIDLLPVLRESASNWNQVASLRNLQFAAHLDIPRLPVMGDENALRRVIDIAADDQTRIFERFYRVDKARSRELGGAGLGLAIAQWIVQLHKGSITVQSEPSRGSVFRMEIPSTR